MIAPISSKIAQVFKRGASFVDDFGKSYRCIGQNSKGGYVFKSTVPESERLCQNMRLYGPAPKGEINHFLVIKDGKIEKGFTRRVGEYVGPKDPRRFVSTEFIKEVPVKYDSKKIYQHYTTTEHYRSDITFEKMPTRYSVTEGTNGKSYHATFDESGRLIAGYAREAQKLTPQTSLVKSKMFSTYNAYPNKMQISDKSWVEAPGNSYNKCKGKGAYVSFETLGKENTHYHFDWNRYKNDNGLYDFI